MLVRIEAYTSTGLASGWLAGSATLHEVLDAGGDLSLDRAQWVAVDATEVETRPSLRIPVDDVLVALGPDDGAIPVHATWHRISLDVGPYVVEGDLATMPGFDPGRALTRPSGEFIVLRHVRLSIAARPEVGEAAGDHALVNRYAVERIRSELMLGFFFPGAEVEAVAGGVAVRP